MSRLMLISLIVVLGMFMRTTVWALDAGVMGRKLILLNKVFTAGTAKTVYVSKLDAGIQKGPAGDPSLLTGSFEWFFTDEPSSVYGAFNMPSSNWVDNADTVAKFDNVDSSAGTATKIVVVKPNLLAKFVGRALGDVGASPSTSPPQPSDSGGITTVLTINNGNDSSTHRMCTKFAIDDGSIVSYKEIAGGTGRKLVARNGVPTTCP